VVSSGGNVTVGIGGTSNVAVFATTGEFVTGVVSVTGTITGGNLATAGFVDGGILTTPKSLLGNVTQSANTNGAAFYNLVIPSGLTMTIPSTSAFSIIP
jgi:hypothetical protein